MPSSEPASTVTPAGTPSGVAPAETLAGDALRAELARAAHDVNNALNSVLVGSHLLQLSADDADAVRRHADRIAHAARQGVAAAARTVALLRASNAAVESSSHASEPAP
jgi:hypothetical protein